MKVEVRNNARNEKRVLEYYNDVEAFEAIHEKILSDDQASAEFEANNWGDPYELTLDKFVNGFGASITVGDYTYSFMNEIETKKELRLLEEINNDIDELVKKIRLYEGHLTDKEKDDLLFVLMFDNGLDSILTKVAQGNIKMLSLASTMIQTECINDCNKLNKTKERL